MSKIKVRVKVIRRFRLNLPTSKYYVKQYIAAFYVTVTCVVGIVSPSWFASNSLCIACAWFFPPITYLDPVTTVRAQHCAPLVLMWIQSFAVKIILSFF